MCSILSDWLGTRRVQTDYAGNVEETCRSLPYGNSLECLQTGVATADDATEHHFTGKERDAETGFENGNDYFEARYYASSMGRFLSPDWSSKVAPVPYAKLEDPQSLNLYAYVLNDPMVRIDLDGHSGRDWCASGPDSLACRVQTYWNTRHGIISHGAQQQNTQSGRGLTIGVGVSGNGDAGVDHAGAEANGTAVVTGSVSLKGRFSVGAAASGATVAYAGKHVAAEPSQETPPHVTGGYAGGGVTFIVANTASSKQLSGPFQTIQGNIGLFGFSLSGSISSDHNGDKVLQFTLGPGWGFSVWSVTTNTKAACAGPGC